VRQHAARKRHGRARGGLGDGVRNGMGGAGAVPPGISSQATSAHLPASCRRPPPCRPHCLLAHRRGPPPCRSPPPASPPPCRPPPPASLPPCRPLPRASSSTGKRAGASRKSEEAGGAGWRDARPVGIW
jgi:hypothetical protein